MSSVIQEAGILREEKPCGGDVGTSDGASSSTGGAAAPGTLTLAEVRTSTQISPFASPLEELWLSVGVRLEAPRTSDGSSSD